MSIVGNDKTNTKSYGITKDGSPTGVFNTTKNRHTQNIGMNVPNKLN